MEGRDSAREEQRDELCSKSHSSVCIPKCSASVVRCTNFNASVPNRLLLHSTEVTLFCFSSTPIYHLLRVNCKQMAKNSISHMN